MSTTPGLGAGVAVQAPALTPFRKLPNGGWPPTLNELVGRVEQMLLDYGCLGLVLVDLEPLASIEHEYGSLAYNNIILCIADKLAAQGLRTSDLICLHNPFSEQIVVFLDRPRNERELSSHDLDVLVDRLWGTLTAHVAEIVRNYECTERLRMGYAMMLHNPMIQPERRIYRALGQAGSIARDHGQRLMTRARERLGALLAARQLTSVYQPIVELATMTVRGYEALVRGPRDTPLATPDMLFSLAAQADLVGELVRACVESNFTHVDAVPEGTSLFINVAPCLLHDPSFHHRLFSYMQGNMAPTRVVLEINESVATPKHDFLMQSITELRSRGVQLAIDDMGVGYSNLEHVLRLRPDFLKLDLSLVRNVHCDDAKRALVGSLVSMARAVGAVVVAEGIEQPAERDALLEIGVPWAQGFLFARPEPHFHASPLGA